MMDSIYVVVLLTFLHLDTGDKNRIAAEGQDTLSLGLNYILHTHIPHQVRRYIFQERDKEAWSLGKEEEQASCAAKKRTRHTYI